MTGQVWGLNSTTPHFTLEGHDRGVNCINYFPGGEKPFLVSGADDQLIKVWDYQTKTCVATLEGHTNNVSAVAFHPHLPLIITGSEVCLARSPCSVGCADACDELAVPVSISVHWYCVLRAGVMVCFT